MTLAISAGHFFTKTSAKSQRTVYVFMIKMKSVFLATFLFFHFSPPILSRQPFSKRHLQGSEGQCHYHHSDHSQSHNFSTSSVTVSTVVPSPTSNAPSISADQDFAQIGSHNRKHSSSKVPSISVGKSSPKGSNSATANSQTPKSTSSYQLKYSYQGSVRLLLPRI